MLRFVVISMLLIVLLGQAGTPPAAAADLAAAPAGYIFCANANHTCSFNGTGGVAFGANGHFKYKVAVKKIACNLSAFGDPLPGVKKACYYQIVPQPGRRQATYFTSYGYNDNDDGNGHYGTAVIAYPDEHHPIATEGLGTYADPITFATDENEIPPHTMIYVLHLQKYFFMEDGCAECSANWKNGHIWRTDLFMGENTRLQAEPALANCEDKITRNSVMYINPGPGFPVDVTPMFLRGRCSARMH